MIKTLYIFILLIIFSSFASACKCQGEINNIFQKVSDYIVNDNINQTINNIDSSLIPQIQNNIDTINAETTKLNVLLKVEREKSLEAKRLVFLLQKTIEMNNLE